MSSIDSRFLRVALSLARRGYGSTSPNPMVGAVLVKGQSIIGQGWHRNAGGPHAEIEAILDAEANGHKTKGATLYVTLEPCCTQGRTPPCTKAIILAGIRRVVVGATDPNPKHAGEGFRILRQSRIQVDHGVLSDQATRLNEAFNHWIVNRTPFVTVKAAMTLDGKIATAQGESKWITNERARAYGMKLRLGADAILVGVNTVLADDPSLTVRLNRRGRELRMRRFVLDSLARTPLGAKVVDDKVAALTTIVVSEHAPGKRVTALAKRADVWVAPSVKSSRGSIELDLRWLVKRLGAENVSSLLVEGGGEVNATFLFGGLTQRVAFFYEVGS